jgi:hypothetical protein
MTSTLRICRNLSCLLVLPQTDMDLAAQYKDVEIRCPRFGTLWKGRPTWKGPPREREDQ